MLGTLLKYEFKAVGRLLLPLYGAWLIAAVLLGLSIGNGGTGSGPLFIALSGVLYGGSTMVAVVLTCIILIQRFYKNLLGNEGYLMFTLPVSTGKHIINKTISGATWGTAGIIVAVISALLIAGCIEGFGTIFDNFNFVFGEVTMRVDEMPNLVVAVIEILLIIFLAFAETAAKVYAAIAVGHQWGNHRVLGAIGAYIGFGIIETIIGNILGDGLPELIFDMTLDMSDMAAYHFTMILVIIGIAIVAAIYGVISWLLLDRRLNLE